MPFRMRSSAIGFVGVFAAAALMWANPLASGSGDEPLFKAMQDELRRSMTQLKMGALEKPYYLEYYLEDGRHWNISASLGAIVQNDSWHARPYGVRLRVGDYELDNSNYDSGQFPGSFGSGLASPTLPVEDEYWALRRRLWLRTDRAYKEALGTLSRKRAYLKNVQTRERIEDFSRAQPVVEIAPAPASVQPGEKWERALRRLSALLKPFPRIQRSSVGLHVYAGTHYLVNSEGFRYRQPEQVVRFHVMAALQAEDGSPVRNESTLLVRTLRGLPPLAGLERAVERTASEAIRSAEAPLADDYSGPVLFSPEAAAHLLAHLLAPHLSGTPPPDRPAESFAMLVPQPGGAWSSKWKARVLPSTFSVVDDPTVETFAGSPLLGSFRVDREGVRAERVRLVEKGRLVNFLMSRAPRSELWRSNGHGRALGAAGVVQARPGNLFVTSSESESRQQLETRLIEEAKAQEKDFGILVTKLGPVASGDRGSFDEGLAASPGNPFAGFPEAPVLAYRVWVKDGRKELVRGFQFSALTPRALRDVVAAGNETFVYNHLSTVVSAAGMELIPTTIVSPALLFEDLDLKVDRGKTRKQPVLPSPLADNH